MTIQLSALRLFVRVAATGSFSQAARELELSQPTASRIIAQLEKELGVTLVVRTTRAVTLTEAGAEYVARIKPLLDGIDEAGDAVRGDGELRGVLRVGVSSVMASRILLPCLAKFTGQHEHLRIELVTDDQRQDLISENLDVVIRFGKLADSSSLARRLGTWPLIVATAPSYIDRYGAPSSAADLAQHQFVVAGPAAGRTVTLHKDGQDVVVHLHGKLAITSTEAAINAAVAGFGLVIASSLSLKDAIARRELVRVLDDWQLADITAHALFASGQTPKPAARAFVDFLGEELKSD